jgi:hypothetical protein
MYKSAVNSHELYYRLAEIIVSETYHSVCAEIPEFAEDIKYISCTFGEITISNYPTRATLLVQGNSYLLQPQLDMGITGLSVDISVGFVGPINKQN